MNLQSMSHQGALTKIAVFKGKKIRKVIYKNEWWFSIIDAIEVLTDTDRPRKYWSDLKNKLIKEGYGEVSEKIGQLKLIASDGKLRETDCADTETLFRIIQSIPSPKAEPFKRWLAKVGYALWYSSSSFNEAASFALFSLLAICVIDRWGLPYVCIIAFACTITKEIAFPFVVYFMFLSFIARESRTAYRSSLLNRVFLFFSQYKSGLACVAVGIAVNLAFNYFRFGTALNTFNLNPGFITPWSYVPIFFAYLFISPAGGLLFTWFSLCLLLIISLFIAKCDRATAWIVMLATLGLVIANLGLARWYSPFGWCAWGPRLTFPFLGAVGVIAVYLVTTQVINFFMEAGKKYWLLIFVCVVVVSSLPNLTARLDPGAFFVKMFAPTKIEIESGIKNFTVQLAPANLYMAAASKIYARNIVLPITFDVARHKWPISLLWLFSLYLISKRIFSAD